MVVFFSLLFFQFARLSSSMADAGRMAGKAAKSPEIAGYIAEGTTRVAFAEGTPKLFLAVDRLDLPQLVAREGTLSLEDNEMILGYEEAEMMRNEGLFQEPGDVLKDFFGLPSMRIVGILEPTRTMLDSYHLVSPGTLSKLKTRAEVQAVVAEGNLKLFYRLQDDNIPVAFQERIAPGSFEASVIGGRPYVPMYIGAAEAKMMTAEGLFKAEGDLIKNLFGNNVIVAGILPETNTPLDQMHFAGADLQLPQ